LDLGLEKKTYIEEFEVIKWAIRICKLKKDREHNGQKKNDEIKNNVLQNM
jgi:hypothetical protein